MATQKKRYLIPMEVTKESIKDLGISEKEVSYQKIGNKRRLVHLVESTEEEYREYMRPEWREDKRVQRHSDVVSLDSLYDDYEYEPIDTCNSIEDEAIKREMFEKLNELLEELENIDRVIIKMFMESKSEKEIGRTVGLSQKAINKRKHKIFNYLKLNLKDYY